MAAPEPTGATQQRCQIWAGLQAPAGVGLCCASGGQAASGGVQSPGRQLAGGAALALGCWPGTWVHMALSDARELSPDLSLSCIQAGQTVPLGAQPHPRSACQRTPPAARPTARPTARRGSAAHARRKRPACAAPIHLVRHESGKQSEVAWIAGEAPGCVAPGLVWSAVQPGRCCILPLAAAWWRRPGQGAADRAMMGAAVCHQTS
jgi:hypothetical protein